MDKYRKLHEAMKAAYGAVAVLPLINAEVTEVTGESCTVKYGELELTEVRLKATINGNGDKLLMLPKVGSMVLIGSLTGDLKSLAVLRVNELEKLEYEQNGLKIGVDSTDGKLSIQNNSINLKDVFQGLTDLLKQFKVTTPSGPSTAILPDTMQAVMKFETDFKNLLK
jgi:hypothetical protein